MPEPRKNRRMRSWWVALAAVPFGFTTWAAFLYAGLRTKRRSLLVASGVYGAMLIGYVLLDTAGHSRGADLAVGTILALGAWIGGFVHALAIRRSVEAQLDLVDSTAVEAASRALARRQYGRELVRTQPALAKQLGVGRPDLPNSDSYGLIDVNHADAAALATLPGMTDDLAVAGRGFLPGGRVVRLGRGSRPFSRPSGAGRRRHARAGGVSEGGVRRAAGATPPAALTLTWASRARLLAAIGSSGAIWATRPGSAGWLQATSGRPATVAIPSGIAWILTARPWASATIRDPPR